ncbi:hypothetical protein [Peribacillus asahii]|uniref:hypothetical protein n=1 Tax=Peribacillus asahii TaxID=228899 RepID=UPI00380EBBE4
MTGKKIAVIGGEKGCLTFPNLWSEELMQWFDEQRDHRIVELPDIDRGLDVSCNLGDISQDLKKVGSGLGVEYSIDPEDNSKILATVTKLKETITPIYGAVPNIGPIARGIRKGFIIHNEWEHALSVIGQSGVRSAGMFMNSLASMYPEPEILSPRERKKRYREGVKNIHSKKKHWM